MTSKTEKFEPGCQTQEHLDKRVSETFDELFAEISSKDKLHPSEAYNKRHVKTDSKIYEFVNSYHAVCRLCDQQFYCYSLADDINSFFQKHMNTSYHRQNRAVNRPPDDVPMFTWEEKFYSGRCNVCDLSGLNAFVLKTGADVRKLMDLHVCMWSSEHRQTNEKFLKKLTLLRKYCGLKIFQEKCLKKIKGRDVCSLCGLSFPPTGKTPISHLSSDIHYQSFCTLLRKVFSFEPKDILNGFNLEMVTRWVLGTDPPPVVEYAEYDERKVCLEHSNNNENPYFGDGDNFSFSPNLFREDKDTDFIHNGECMLCNVEFKPGHGNTQGHKAKAANVGRHSFDIPEKYAAYEMNRERRLFIVDTLKKLKSGQLDLKAPEPRPATGITLRENFFKDLLVEKLKLVKEVFTMGDDGNSFCHVCESSMRSSYERVHLTMSPHKYNADLWKYLEANLGNVKLTEPFVKINFLFACLLCGTTFLPDGFCSHLKLESHLRQYEKYCSLDSKVLITSAVVFQKDFSCYCTLCNAKLNQRQSFSSVKMTLRNLRSHWPCPKLGKGKEDAGNKQNAKKGGQNNQNKDAVVWSLVKESESCANETVDFKKVEGVVESVLGVFENKIISGVLEKAASLIDNLGSSKGTAIPDIKEKLNLETDGRVMEASKEPTSSETSSATSTPTENEKKEVEDKRESLETAAAESTEKKTADREVAQDELNNIKSDHEILIIEGLPNRTDKKLRHALNSKFKAFGTILCIDSIRLQNNSKGKAASLAFAKRGVAEAVAKGPQIHLGNFKLNLTATTRKSNLGAGNNTSTPTESEKKAVDKRGTVKSAENKKKDVEEDKLAKNHEILIIDGLPKHAKRKILKNELLSKFSEFGNIRYLNIEKILKSEGAARKRLAVVAFDKSGVAEAVAEGPEIYLNDSKLYLMATTRESYVEASWLSLSLNDNLIRFFENPQALMDFVLNLILKAVRASESPVEIKREEMVCSSIITAVLDRFPQARCYPFGSRLSGLVLDNSDLDVFLDCGGMYDGFKNTSGSAERKLVKQVERLLRQKGEITDIVVVSRARVPIISFIHKSTLLHCDLSFKNGLSVQNTLLIKFLISLDWRVRPLILFLKFWAKLNKLHGPPYFSSYAIAMLVIFYVQQLDKPVLPTIESLQKSYLGRRKTIAGWDCSINTLTPFKCDNVDSLPNLLVGLFEYYKNFDYKKDMVSPLTGKPLPKEAYSVSGFTNLPLGYKRHVFNLPALVPHSQICIVDPFDVTHILTKSFTSRGLQAFVRFCETSASHLRKGVLACQA